MQKYIAMHYGIQPKYIKQVGDFTLSLFKLFLNNRKCENIQSQNSCILRKPFP